jgi:hypothetical protein
MGSRARAGTERLALGQHRRDFHAASPICVMLLFQGGSIFSYWRSFNLVLVGFGDTSCECAKARSLLKDAC